jgi:hypothetical protein
LFSWIKNCLIDFGVMVRLYGGDENVQYKVRRQLDIQGTVQHRTGASRR